MRFFTRLIFFLNIYYVYGCTPTFLTNRHCPRSINIPSASEQAVFLMTSQTPLFVECSDVVWLQPTDGRMAEYRERETALAVTASVACSCGAETNCIVTKVTTAGHRDPSSFTMTWLHLRLAANRRWYPRNNAIGPSLQVWRLHS